METIRDLTDKYVASGELEVFDFALPQAWWDDFYKKMGFAPFGFVWNYPNKSIWGEPFPLTDEARENLKVYNAK